VLQRGVEAGYVPRETRRVVRTSTRQRLQEERTRALCAQKARMSVGKGFSAVTPRKPAVAPGVKMKQAGARVRQAQEHLTWSSDRIICQSATVPCYSLVEYNPQPSLCNSRQACDLVS
jgi:hypothetical protein